ncbi:MAG TPA: type IV pilus secretin PilQ [Terriglobales bacterium]|jgi:type IV pilus secretin PilQ/predicted competence protein|nr:type IV pilus secretin PilQ [Terriglobales bacterium]
MRKQLLGLLVPPLAFVLIAAAGDTTGKGVAASARLQKLEVAHSQDGLQVEFIAKGTIAPKVSTLESPARIVVDFPNTVVATAQNRISVGQDGVKDVRIGMDGQVPPTTHVVIDLTANFAKDCQHELVAGADGSFTLKVHDAVVAKSHGQAPTPKTVATTAAPKLVLASASTVATATAPVPTNVAAASPASSSTGAPAATENAGKPTDFAFVEPKYSVKDAKADAKTDSNTGDKAAEPAAKAQEAASRFADKTASELVASNSNAAQAAGTRPIQPAVNLAAEQKAQMEQQKPASTGSKYTGEPISVNLKDVDLKDFFRLIHEISGLNVVLDPQIHGTLTIVLDDVPWDQALDIVLKNNDLSRQLDGNVLRIATVETLRKEAENRRAQIDAEALAVDKVSITRFLSYAHAKDLLLPIKKFLSQRGDVVADERTNSLIVSDIPAVLPQIDRIIQQMDRKTQEVEIEARVVAATRSFARDIGVQLGFGWGNGTTSAGGAPNVGTSSTITNVTNPFYYTTTSGSSGSSIPLFSNLGAVGPTSGFQLINATNNMRIDLILSMAESRGLLKVLSRPRIVTQNNIQAVVKQGVKIPIMTAPSLGSPATATYVDAFLRLTVTPQITSEGTIFLNVDVENTLPNFGQEDSEGNPELITQQATTQVLVTDGGTVVIGGVIQTQNSLSTSQVPLLGDIPYLGNLFKHRSVTTSNQELIFFITPRIVQT